jgi:hypothetical protein
LRTSMPPSATAPLHHGTLNIPPSTPQASRHYYSLRVDSPGYRANTSLEGNPRLRVETAHRRGNSLRNLSPEISGAWRTPRMRTSYIPYAGSRTHIANSLAQDTASTVSTATLLTDLHSSSTGSHSASMLDEELLQPPSPPRTNRPPNHPIRDSLHRLLQDQRRVRSNFESLSEGTGERLHCISRRLSRVGSNVSTLPSLPRRSLLSCWPHDEPQLAFPHARPDSAANSRSGFDVGNTQSNSSMQVGLSSLGSSESLSLCDRESRESPVWAAERRALSFRSTLNMPGHLSAASWAFPEPLPNTVAAGESMPDADTYLSGVRASNAPLSPAPPVPRWGTSPDGHASQAAPWPAPTVPAPSWGGAADGQASQLAVLPPPLLRTTPAPTWGSSPSRVPPSLSAPRLPSRNSHSREDSGGRSVPPDQPWNMPSPEAQRRSQLCISIPSRRSPSRDAEEVDYYSPPGVFAGLPCACCIAYVRCTCSMFGCLGAVCWPRARCESRSSNCLDHDTSRATQNICIDADCRVQVLTSELSLDQLPAALAF